VSQENKRRIAGISQNSSGGVKLSSGSNSDELFIEHYADDSATATSSNDYTGDHAIQIESRQTLNDPITLLLGTDKSNNVAYIRAGEQNITSSRPVLFPTGINTDSNLRVQNSSSLLCSFIAPVQNFLTLSGGSDDIFLQSNGNTAAGIGDTGSQFFDQAATNGNVTIRQQVGTGDEMGVGNLNDELELFHEDSASVSIYEAQSGNLGTLNANTKNFKIKDSANNRWIKHSCAESNLGTQCIYRYRISTSKKEATVDLPDYFEWLVKDEPTVICQPVKHFGNAYAEIYWSGNDPPVPGEPGARLHVKASKDGDYDLLVFATRDKEFNDIIQMDEVKMEE